MKTFLKKEDVHSIYTENEIKSSLAERSIQKLENILHRMFLQRQSYKFADELANITQNINVTPSRPLGNMAPVHVTKETQEEARYNAYLERTKRDKHAKQKVSIKGKKRKKQYKFKLNDQVRISHLKHTFQHEYDQKWTGEIFIITHRFRSQGIDVYSLKDFADEPFSGTFSAQELQKVNKKEDKVWKVDKILKQQKRKGEKELLVSWYQWPSKYNSWIKKSELVNV